MTLTQLRYWFGQYHIHPNKRLGQNFLYDPNMIQRIHRGMMISKDSSVIEVGPGAGALTEGLAQRAGEVWAIEIDKGLVKMLQDRLGGVTHLHCIHADILKWNLHPIPRSKIVLVGNIPYQISSPLIEYIVRNRHQISQAWITVQWEFAKRLVAMPGTRQSSSLSCFVQMYLVPQILFRVPRHVFFPSPEVDSAFVSLEVRSTPAIPVRDEAFFIELIRKGFGHRRKTIVNVFSNVTQWGIKREGVENVLRQLGFVRNVRAEELSLQQWARLADQLFTLQSR